MRLPRDVSGRDVVKVLERLWSRPTRQTGSHVRVTTTLNGEHHVTVPLHDPVKVGTLAAVIRDVAEHHGMSRDDVARKLFARSR